MKREDYPLLTTELIYLDSASTTLKPQIVLDKMIEYYCSYSANIHRGDYDLSIRVDQEYEQARDIAKNFINAKARQEIVFTSGTTESLNMICDGFFRPLLKAQDEIILTKSEHASNLLPWFRLARDLNCQIKYIELDNDYHVTIANLKKVITPQTKLISLAQITNVLGDIRPIKEICQVAHENNIYVVVDGAQSVPHLAVDVQDLACDFLTFSGHKMGGPTGIGILYGRQELLEKFIPLKLGGGMNEHFDHENDYAYKKLPHLLEAGTPNIAGAIALGAAINYLQEIGMNEITTYEKNLRSYLLTKLIDIPHLNIINPKSEGSIITFNVEGIFSQDVACYLNKYHICLRAGHHCAKMVKDIIKTSSTCRISLYLYNTKEEIDKLVELLTDKDKIIREML